jgi:flagellar hook-length control protein FliK
VSLTQTNFPQIDPPRRDISARRPSRHAEHPANARLTAPPIISPHSAAASVTAVQPLSSVVADRPANETELLGLSASAPLRETTIPLPQSLPLPASARSDMSRHIAMQIAAAASDSAARPVELRLNPEELGRVRLSLMPNDGTMTVSIIAERSETLDLMRRHINLLAEEFRDIGYTDIQFAFGSSEQGDADSQTPTGGGAENTARHPEEPVARTEPAGTPQMSADALDLRF